MSTRPDVICRSVYNSGILRLSNQAHCAVDPIRPSLLHRPSHYPFCQPHSPIHRSSSRPSSLVILPFDCTRLDSQTAALLPSGNGASQGGCVGCSQIAKCETPSTSLCRERCAKGIWNYGRCPFGSTQLVQQQWQRKQPRPPHMGLVHTRCSPEECLILVELDHAKTKRDIASPRHRTVAPSFVSMPPVLPGLCCRPT